MLIKIIYSNVIYFKYKVIFYCIIVLFIKIMIISKGIINRKNILFFIK